VGVHAGQGVVEDQYAGSADDGTRDCGPLLLSATERDPAFAYNRLVPTRKSGDVLCDVGRFCRLLDGKLFGQRVHLPRAKRDVLGDGVAEEECLLRHEADI